MAKKKNKQKVLSVSPEKYMQTKVRNLPVGECLMTTNMLQHGKGNIVIARRHASGNVTIGVFLVDTYCTGVTDCFYKYNVIEEDYIMFTEDHSLTTTSYNEAHNIIYGSIAYAEDLGIKPCKEWGIVRHILEPDTEEIPLIEYEFGRNGKPCLVAESKLEASKYLPLLRKHVGEDFDFIIDGEDFSEEKDSFRQGENYEVLREGISNLYGKDKNLPHTEYNYSHPDYPKELKLNHEELNVFYLKGNEYRLDKDVVNTILSLPRESLIEDLDNIILYEIGQSCDEITDEQWKSDMTSPINHSLFLLGELKAEEKLSTVLEVMRQNDLFMEYHFGDSCSDIFPLTLYYLGKNKLSELSAFAKEPDLYIFLKYYLFETATIILYFEPERREEILNWYNDILTFYLANVSDSRYFDAALTGMIMSDLLDIKATELLPVIKQLYDTGMVDTMSCGDYEAIEEKMKEGRKHDKIYSLMSINERYDAYEKKWK